MKQNDLNQFAYNLEQFLFYIIDKIKVVQYSHQEEGGYSCLVYGDYGIGKSTGVADIVDMIEKGLIGVRENKNKCDRLSSGCVYENRGGENPGESKKVKFVTYNAFEFDYSRSPLFSLLSTLEEQGVFNEETFHGIGKALMVGGMTYLKGSSKHINALVEAINAGSDVYVPNFHKLIKNGFSKSSARREAVELIKRALQDYLKEDETLVILIDELDRCRPDFAIDCIEIVKHLFSLKNVVFIFTANKEALLASIKKIYGDHYPAEKYLNRFFYSQKPFPCAYFSPSEGLISERAWRYFKECFLSLGVSCRVQKQLLDLYGYFEKKYPGYLPEFFILIFVLRKKIHSDKEFSDLMKPVELYYRVKFSQLSCGEKMEKIGEQIKKTFDDFLGNYNIATTSNRVKGLVLQFLIARHLSLSFPNEKDREGELILIKDSINHCKDPSLNQALLDAGFEDINKAKQHFLPSLFSISMSECERMINALS